jgi:thiamine pyrophosphate-dependent acetolactate synthase large subunit-like protein
MGRGALPDGHPLALGQSNTGRATEAFREADLVLAVGCQFREVSTRGWSLPMPNLIRIDIAPGPDHPSYPASRTAIADAKHALAQIVERLREQGAGPRSEWKPPASAPAARGSGSDAPYEAVIECIEGAFDSEAILSLDVTMLSYRLLPRRRVERPRSLLYPAAFIAMGYGLPGAIGAKLANPDRTVACIAGDGGFMMTVQELATAVRLGIRLPIVVYNDRCLQSIKRAHAGAHDGHSFEVQLNNPDFVALAEAFGAQGRRVPDLSELPAALEEAKASSGAFLVDVIAP